MRRPMPPLCVCLLAGAVALAGCTDPYARPGTWHAGAVNDANLRAMVADPADLLWGASQPGTDGRLAAAAVERLRSGQVIPMPDESLTRIGTSDTQGTPPAVPSAAASPSAAPGGGS